MKKVIKTFIILIILGILIYTGFEIYKENKIENYNAEKISLEIKNSENNNTEKGNNANNAEDNNQKANKEGNKTNEVNNNKNNENNGNNDNKIEIPKTYLGYNVCCKLKIKKLDIDTCVLSEYTKNSMDVSVVKFYGPNPNEIGNFCIAGHNYITKNYFSKLGTLEIGDKLSLADNVHGEIFYKVYDIYKVEPSQTKVLSQQTYGTRQITLITCTNYSGKRIIVKAIEE